MYYQQNRKRAQIRNTAPTMTDQSQAENTDLNIIVRQFMTTGQAPGARGQPLYGDFTELPRDLRSMIHHARSLEKLQEELPAQLRNHTLDQLFAITNDELVKMMQPPEASTATTQTPAPPSTTPTQGTTST